MSIHHGWDSFLGYAEESSWGVGVHPSTKFMPILNESLQLTPEYMEDESIRKTPSKFYQEQGTLPVGGGIEFNVFPEDMDTFFYHAFGAKASALVGGSSGAYDHTLTLADQLPTGLSIEAYRGGDTFGYHGSKVAELSMTSEINSWLRGTSNLLCYEEEVNPSGKATSPTFTAVKPFKWHQGVFKIDTVEAELLSLNWTLNNNLKEDKFAHNGQKRVAIPRNGQREVTGTFRMEFDDLTQYNKFVNGSDAALQIVFTSNEQIEAGYYYTLTLDFPVVKFNGTTPNIESHEIIEHDIPFMALEDVGSAHEVTMTLRNSQASL